MIDHRRSNFQRCRRRMQRRLIPLVGFVFVTLFGVYALIATFNSIYWPVKERAIAEREKYIRDSGIRKLMEPDEIQRLLSAEESSSKGKVIIPQHKPVPNRPAIIDMSLARLLHVRRIMFIDYDVQLERSIACSAHKTNESEPDLFPDDAFTLQQRRHGAILLHFCGLIYMFVALAIVCDEFFVPSLSVLTEALAISDDVAGATFMAAGGSAPEFFTSVFGVFITQNNVGIGTIVGSATFNILCVLAFCTLFSKEVLQLTWWPLFRDIFFYIFALLFLVAFFLDDRIEVHEALSMFIIYVIYAIIMKYNERLEIAVKVKLFRLSKVGAIERSVDTTTAACGSKQMSKESVTSLRMEHRKSVPVLRSGALFRSGIATLARESTLPEEDNDASLQEQLRRHSLKTIQVRPSNAADNERGSTIRATVSNRKVDNARSVSDYLRNEMQSKTVESTLPSVEAPNAVNTDTRRKAMANNAGQVAMNSIRNGDANDALANGRSVVAAKEERKGSTISNAEKPVDISWPPTTSGRFTYLCLAPIMLPLYVTLPDTKKPSSRRYFVVTFIGSIFWIALFSYLMVWWANTIGETLGIPTEIMGLTVLAAGTSIPDLITSVIVARKGLGDMAVSSSIGSNLFDICIGLPVPWLLHFSFGWLLYGAGDGVRAVSVSSKGLICSVSLLFLMLLVLVFAVAASGWRMNKRFGVIMILSYMLFCVISVLLEIGYMTCPLRTIAVCR